MPSASEPPPSLAVKSDRVGHGKLSSGSELVDDRLVPIQTGSRVIVVWDDPAPAGTETAGTVVGPILASGRDAPGWVVLVDDPVSAEGSSSSGARAVRSGSFLTLQTRHVGQDWEEGGIVQVNLFEQDPRDDATDWLWVASHGVYRVLP